MSTAQLWHSRPIFITSTFRDMHAERDYLRTIVFPELEERLKERRHTLEPIDLRWGVETISIDEEKSKELLVLKVCMSEIERSRPFLIALIGDRYGWIPPQDRLTAAAQEVGFNCNVSEKSITALEIEYSVLKMPGQRCCSRFYFRQPLPYNEMPPEIAAIYDDRHNLKPGGCEAHKRLETLKKRIRRDPLLKDRVHDYHADWDAGIHSVTKLEAWGRMVLENLWADLDEETRTFRHVPTPKWQEQERWALEEFVQNRSRGFVGRCEIIDDIMRYALSPDTPDQPRGMCLIGEPGSGKSALFSYLYQLLQEKDVLLLANVAGISLRSAGVNTILQRWTEEIALHLGMTIPLPEQPDANELQKQFTQLLGRAASRTRVVVMLDALNQLEKTMRARQLTWLPRIWPANTRLIATTLPGNEANALSDRRGIMLNNLPLLQPQEAREIIEGICSRYHRTIHPVVVQTLLNKKEDSGRPASGNPLWLDLAVEELNLLDADDFTRAEKEYSGSYEERLHKLLLNTAEQLPGNVQGLYDWMLERNETVHGKSWSQAFAVLITLGRGGWRESDLRKLMPQFSSESWDDLRFAVLRRSYRAHLVQCGSQSQYDFFHQQIRLAIQRRYLGDEIQLKELHNRIATYLTGLPALDQLRQTEKMYHLIKADNALQAAHYYAAYIDQEEVECANRNLADYILSYEKKSPNPGLIWMLQWLQNRELTDKERCVICHNFIFFLDNALSSDGTFETREALLKPTNQTLSQLAAADPDNIELQGDLAVSHGKLGHIFHGLGNLDAALAAHQNSVIILEKLAKLEPENMRCQRDLSITYDSIGTVFNERGDLDAAVTAYQKAYYIAETLASGEPASSEFKYDLAIAYHRIGNVRLLQGKLASAYGEYKKSYDILIKLVKINPSNTSWQDALSVTSTKLGQVLAGQGHQESALEAFQNSLTISENLALWDPSDSKIQNGLSAIYEQLGELNYAKGNNAEAIKNYQKSLTIKKKLADGDPSNCFWQRDLSQSHARLGDVCKTEGDLDTALKHYQNALNHSMRLAVTDSSNSTWQFDLGIYNERIGDILLAKGHHQQALTRYNTKLTIIKKLASMSPSNKEWQRDVAVAFEKLGDVLQDWNDSPSALEVYIKSLDIRKDLIAADPLNMKWQRDLSIAYLKLGDVYFSSDSMKEALEAYNNCCNIAELNARKNPSDYLQLRDLAIIYSKLAFYYHDTDRNTANSYLCKCLKILRKIQDNKMPMDSQMTDLLRVLEDEFAK